MEGSLLPTPSPWHSLRPKGRGPQRGPNEQHFEVQDTNSKGYCFAFCTKHTHLTFGGCSCTQIPHFPLFSFRLQRTQTYPFPDKPIKVQNEGPRELFFFCIVHCLIQTQFMEHLLCATQSSKHQKYNSELKEKFSSVGDVHSGKDNSMGTNGSIPCCTQCVRWYLLGRKQNTRRGHRDRWSSHGTWHHTLLQLMFPCCLFSWILCCFLKDKGTLEFFQHRFLNTVGQLPVSLYERTCGIIAADSHQNLGPLEDKRDGCSTCIMRGELFQLHPTHITLSQSCVLAPGWNTDQMQERSQC